MSLTTVIAVAILTQDGQEAKTSLKKPKPALSANGAGSKEPVTLSEARTVFVRARGVISEVLGKKLASPKLAEGKEVAKREVLIAEFGRLLNEISPSFKTIPNPVQFDPKRFKLSVSTVVPVAEKLVSLGAVAPFGALVSGPSAGLSPRDFGDSLGFFLARMAQLTHTPTGKWTPALGAGSGVEN